MRGLFTIRRMSRECHCERLGRTSTGGSCHVSDIPRSARDDRSSKRRESHVWREAWFGVFNARPGMARKKPPRRGRLSGPGMKRSCLPCPCASITPCRHPRTDWSGCGVGCNGGRRRDVARGGSVRGPHSEGYAERQGCEAHSCPCLVPWRRCSEHTLQLAVLLPCVEGSTAAQWVSKKAVASEVARTQVP